MVAWRLVRGALLLAALAPRLIARAQDHGHHDTRWEEDGHDHDEDHEDHDDHDDHEDHEDHYEDDEPDEYALHIENLIPEASFTSPFNSHDESGQRFVPNWLHGGDALTKQSFVRLTPDTPFASGYLWSKKPLGTDVFSLEWKFRISGLQETGAGEHLGLWITDQARPREGDVFGMDAAFTGIGIVVDTKRNEGDNRHRDVSVVMSDGRRTREQIQSNLVGCNANVRYWEGRDDFNVLRATRIRVNENLFTLDIDARNTGRWRRCVTMNTVDLPRGWAERATAGLLAGNQAESNNNDVLSLRLYKSADSAWVLEKYEGEDEDADGEWGILVHHIEHEMFTVHNSLKSAVQLLEKAETSAEHRITALENKLSGDIARKLEERMRALEGQVHRSVTRSVHSKVTAAEKTMAERMESTLSGSAAQAARTWRYPFYLLCGAVGAMCLLSYLKYNELRKEHLL
ncbi:concanavalin A-like lectin/glucanase domain-containing protein [Tribonema minus]|uniref:Concanavalin A-like lectin/glucanase domain-containing protein n=1 Tax=Tribonema minus TaxID=303371 RepID=A0A835YN92_9STRA|nr:concanavalin A-like lectin/glucanase domain-containing protein [Tribonema minus]